MAHMAGPSGRDRDLLSQLPLWGAPTAPTSSGRSRSRAAAERAVRGRTNGALRTLMSLASGQLGSLSGDAEALAGETVGKVNPLEKEVSDSVYAAHSKAHEHGLHAVNPESALLRLLASPSRQGYGAGTVQKEASPDDAPAKGTVVSLARGVASLPIKESAPIQTSRSSHPKSRTGSEATWRRC